MINPLKLKSRDIKAAMLNRWAAPEWAIMWEVGQGTGSMSGRRADAVMMSLWPSRGLELHGVEIKVSRSDWKREAADPTKAEAIAKYCHRWWIHTPEGVVDDVSDMPPAWGLREWTGKKWITRKDAEKTEATPVSYHFLAAMLRRSDEGARALAMAATDAERQALISERAKIQEDFHARVQREVARRTHVLTDLKKRVEEADEVFGGDFFGWSMRHKKLAAAAAFIAKLDKGILDMLSRDLRATAESLAHASEAIDNGTEV